MGGKPGTTANCPAPSDQPSHPATAYQARPKANAGDRGAGTHERLRRDRIDTTGKITLRYQGRLYSIGIGRTHARTHVLILVQDLRIRLMDSMGFAAPAGGVDRA